MYAKLTIPERLKDLRVVDKHLTLEHLAEQAMKDADVFYQRLSSRMERRYLVDASQTCLLDTAICV